MQKQKFPSKDNNVLENKYVITKKLKTGGFGSVYYARGIRKDTNKYAVKFTHKANERYCNIQRNIYKLIKQNKFTMGFIKYFDYGNVNDQIYQVMELVGYDLEQIVLRLKNKKTSVKTALMIGLQVIDRLQVLHQIGYVHRDIKPDNLAIGDKQKNNIIYLFDFGLAIKNEDAIPNYEKGKIIGTLGYMSIRQHESKKATFFDDLQSFVYTLIYLIQGTLPWMHIKVNSAADVNKVKAMKGRLDKDWFIKNKMPTQLSQLLEIARNAKQLPSIDYLNVKFKLISALKSINQQNDFNFDWIGLIKVTHDSPDKIVQQKQKINKMNQSNQKHVQQEIYQIYKFMNSQKVQQQTSTKKANSPKKTGQRQKIQPVVTKQKIEQRKQETRRKNIESNKKIERPRSVNLANQQKIKRPASGQFFHKQMKMQTQKMKYLRQMELKMNQFSNAKDMGPKIVINHNTNYRL